MYAFYWRLASLAEMEERVPNEGQQERVNLYLDPTSDNVNVVLTL
jgi:hypothetical protein